MSNLRKVEEVALQLSYDERIDLMEVLRLSLEAEHSPAEIEGMWAVECERRLKDIESGTVKTISHDELMAHMRDKHGWK